MADDQPQQPQAPEEGQPQFAIEKVYLKDLSLEIPHGSSAFLEREAPRVEIHMHNDGKGLADGVFEVVLTVTVTAKVGDKTIFLVEAAQAGIFQIRNVPPQDVDPILHVTCPNILLPFVREAVSSTVTRAGFPAVVLSPLNFEALYIQRRQQQAAGAAEPESKPTTH
jgi:preprotein translocase subunit SecB